MRTLPWLFAVLQYLRNISPLIDSLSCHLQKEVNIMGYGAAVGGRHLGFYKKLKFIGKTRKLQIFFARVVTYDTIKHFIAFGWAF